jgi:DNA helicase IV
LAGTSRRAESGDVPGDDFATEQAYVTRLYDRLDELRERAADRVAAILRNTGGTPQARSERDSAHALYTEKLAQYDAVETGLCFGRLDSEGGVHRHIGRIGLFAEAAEGGDEPLLIDWRAPAARPFYLATAASPQGVTRRRHIRTKHRTVVGLDDEVLDLAAARSATSEGLTGEAALLAALDASRTGRMKDIVETIQVEQDNVIRADLNGTLVVQGGPGTGKTAVALHRAAYLLYTYRGQLASRGVLIVGPNATFLRYISQVLPSLAETGVLLGTIGDLFPGVTARRSEPVATAEIKGRPAMAGVLAAAIRDRQRVPDEPMQVSFERETLWLDRKTYEQARAQARRSGKLHNAARTIFERAIVDALAAQVAELIGTDPYADDPLGGDDAPGDPNLFGEADMADIRRDLLAEPSVREALDELWPILTPQKLLTDLFASADRLSVAAPDLTEGERALLLRPPGGGWTPADVPLLDEVAELLGDDASAAAERTRARQRQRDEYAEGVLEIARGSRSLEAEHDDESELLLATDLLHAQELAQRQVDGPALTTAQRAAADRRWAFGHVIVDEAQELSPMAWRMLMRRIPSRSMTVVGDVAQTGDLSGAGTWESVLSPYLADRWRRAELTVNYRTPAEVMQFAAGVLAAIDPARRAPRSVRHTGTTPWTGSSRPGRLGSRLVPAVLREAAHVAGGRVGVIVPAGLLEELGRVITDAVPEAAVGEDPELERSVVLLTVRQAKGLEFDSVLVVEPATILAESPRGLSDLYVALTRATQRLGVLHCGELPPVLAPI